MAVSSLRFEGRADITFAFFSETFTVNASTDKATVARATGYYTGDLVRFTTTNTLPAATGGGLSIDTDYYVIYVSATEIKFARTLALALAGIAIDLTDTGTGIHTINLYSYPVTMYQQTSVFNVNIGSSDGITAFQTFDFPDKGILKATVIVSVSGVTYTQVDSFIDSLPTDNHYRFGVKSDDSCYILFGNGDGTSGYGAIPPNFPVVVSYAYGGGANCNISTANKVSMYSGGNADIDFVSNLS